MLAGGMLGAYSLRIKALVLAVRKGGGIQWGWASTRPRPAERLGLGDKFMLWARGSQWHAPLQPQIHSYAVVGANNKDSTPK